MDPINPPFLPSTGVTSSAHSDDRDADGRQLLYRRKQEEEAQSEEKSESAIPEKSESHHHPKPLDCQGTHLDLDA